MSQNDNVAHALSGAGGGALAMVVTYPLITLSTRAQTATKAKVEKLKDGAGLGDDSAAAKVKKVSSLDAAKQIIKTEGVSGLYSGLESALFGISITNFVYYYFYEGTKAVYLKKSPQLTTGQSMLAGAIAGSATCVLTNPIWVINTRQTVKSKGVDSNKSTLSTIKDVVQKEGVSALFAGLAPALVLVINPILQYTIFEQLKNFVEKKRKLGPLDAFWIGALGKIVATSVTYPYITLKSRLQVKAEGASSSLIKGIQKIIESEGVSGLYKGIDTKIVQSTLTSAFLFFFKEQLFASALILLGLIRRLRGGK